MLSFGMEYERAFSIAFWSARFADGSPPPSFAATMIARVSFEKSLPRFASAAPFLCLIVDHLLCPDTRLLPYLMQEQLVNARVVEPEMVAVEHDHAGAGAEDRRVEAPQRLVEAVEPHQAHDRGGLAARHDQPVEPCELLGQPHLDRLGAETPEHRRVLAKVSLHGEDADSKRPLHDAKSRGAIRAGGGRGGVRLRGRARRAGSRGTRRRATARSRAARSRGSPRRRGRGSRLSSTRSRNDRRRTRGRACRAPPSSSGRCRARCRWRGFPRSRRATIRGRPNATSRGGCRRSARPLRAAARTPTGAR